MATNPDKRSVDLPNDDEVAKFDDITQTDQAPNTATQTRTSQTNPDMRAVNLPTDDEVVHIDDITQVDEEPRQGARARTEQQNTRLWLLTRKPSRKRHNPSLNEVFVMVVEAPDEQQARQQAAASSEGNETENTWTDSTMSSCSPIELSGQTRVVTSDFVRG